MGRSIRREGGCSAKCGVRGAGGKTKDYHGNTEGKEARKKKNQHSAAGGGNQKSVRVSGDRVTGERQKRISNIE